MILHFRNTGKERNVISPDDFRGENAGEQCEAINGSIDGLPKKMQQRLKQSGSLVRDIHFTMSLFTSWLSVYDGRTQCYGHFSCVASASAGFTRHDIVFFLVRQELRRNSAEFGEQTEGVSRLFYASSAKEMC